MEAANEVQETLGRSYNLPDDIDEDDLEAGKIRKKPLCFQCLTKSGLGRIGCFR